MLEREDYADHCHGLNSIPPNSYVEVLCPNVPVFAGRTFREVIKAK